MSAFTESSMPSPLTGAAMYQACVPPLVRGLRAIAAELEKAAADATTRNFDAEVLVRSRLAPDMLNLAGQVQRASDTAKLTVERLSGVASPRFPDTEQTVPELLQRVTATIDYLQGVDASQFEGSPARIVEVSLGKARGDTYLLEFGLPNFYFHVALVHAILRHNGVPVGKLDYLGLKRPAA